MVQRGQEPDVRAVGTDPGPVQGGEDRPCGAEQPERLVDEMTSQIPQQAAAGPSLSVAGLS